jgi:CheY-like chemotaxis protein
MNKKILVVDDDLYLRELYQEVLRSEGYDVETAEDGEMGLAKLHIGGFDLVILDVMLPKLDGAGILEALANDPPVQSNGPIILLTNLANDPLITSAEEKGVADYLIKADITPQDLIDRVKQHLSQTGSV